MVESTIKVSKRVQILASGGGSGTEVTPALLATAISGGATYWSRLRVERIDAWGSANADATLTLSVAPSIDWSQPAFKLTDAGTAGSSRPAVGVRLGLLDRARFYGTADSTVLCTVMGGGTGSDDVVIQASIELLSAAM